MDELRKQGADRIASNYLKWMASQSHGQSKYKHIIYRGCKFKLFLRFMDIWCSIFIRQQQTFESAILPSLPTNTSIYSLYLAETQSRFVCSSYRREHILAIDRIAQRSMRSNPGMRALSNTGPILTRIQIFLILHRRDEERLSNMGQYLPKFGIMGDTLIVKGIDCRYSRLDVLDKEAQ